MTERECVCERDRTTGSVCETKTEKKAVYRESVESVRRSQCLFRRFLLRRKLPTNMS